ncbi:MAG TPA: hypothetical protein VG944_05270 [Fimbriimonas sp.]|nr:hypothetical protein [Fimbriimonas sp.]
MENQPRLASPGPLLLDDCQEVLANSKQRVMLRLALEHQMRAGRATCLSFTSPKITRPIRNFLPHPREWTICLIGNPEPAERKPLISQMAAADGLSLSSTLIRIIAQEMHGNGRTLSGALKRLRLAGTTWQDGHGTVRACGLLDPFFADNSSWDLKHRILRTTENLRSMLKDLSPADLSIYVMLRVASLSESEVARATDTEPAEVYLRACKFEREILKDQSKSSTIRQYLEAVANSLTGE